MPGAVPRVFYEQIKYHRYDVSEMSMSSYLRMRPLGFPYRMLPVFHNRTFSYTNVYIRKAAGIRQDHPEDLKGKRFGIGDYQQSVGLWTRGILKLEWGVEPQDMTWFMERSEHFSHTGASKDAGLGPPEDLDLRHATTDFSSMYLDGELDASIGIGSAQGSGIDRMQSVNLIDNPDFPTLFSDPKAESVRFFQKHGVFPPHHVTVVRESIVEEHPWVAVSLMEAFESSKRLAIQRLRAMPPTLYVFGRQFQQEVDERVRGRTRSPTASRRTPRRSTWRRRSPWSRGSARGSSRGTRSSRRRCSTGRSAPRRRPAAVIRVTLTRRCAASLSQRARGSGRAPTRRPYAGQPRAKPRKALTLALSLRRGDQTAPTRTGRPSASDRARRLRRIRPGRRTRPAPRWHP